MNAGDAHLLKEERQFVTVWGQPLRVQGPMKTQTQSPTRVRGVVQPGFLHRQTAKERRTRCQAEERPPPRRPPPRAGMGGGAMLKAGPDVWDAWKSDSKPPAVRAPPCTGKRDRAGPVARAR